MSIPRENNAEAAVLVFVDADKRADIEALCGFLKAGLVKEEPERIGEGKFVVRLLPGVHDVMGVER